MKIRLTKSGMLFVLSFALLVIYHSMVGPQ